LKARLKAAEKGLFNI